MLDLKLGRQALRESPNVVVVSLMGQAEFANSLKLEKFFDTMLREDEPRHVLLDLCDLTFADSAFFSSLLFWKERLGQQGGRLVLYGLRPEIAGPMRIMALDRVLTIRPDQPSALETL